MKGAITAKPYGDHPANAGKLDIKYSSVTLRQEAVKASKTNRPKNSQEDNMYLSNKQTPLQEYKTRMLLKAMAAARSMYQG